MANVMKKILQGVVKFNTAGDSSFLFLKHMKQRAQGVLKAETLYITCIDARLPAKELTGSRHGEIFYVRNPGNMVPAYSSLMGGNVSSEAGALELCCTTMGIRNVIVCGHSDCKAVECMYGLRQTTPDPQSLKSSPLIAWIMQHAPMTMAHFSPSALPLVVHTQLGRRDVKATIDPESKLSEVDKLSQIHVLQQASNVSTYPFLQDMITSGELAVNALWFDVQTGKAHAFSPLDERFLVISEDNVEYLSQSLTQKS